VPSGQSAPASGTPPRRPIDLLEDALSDLEKSIAFGAPVSTASHVVIEVTGFDDARVAPALGRYLVGALAGAVQLDARLSDVLLAIGADARTGVAQDVVRLVGATNSFSGADEIRFRNTKRNPWIGEGIGHALLALSARQVTTCVDGRVCTLSRIHPTATRQGLDYVGLYTQPVGGSTSDLLGIAVGECKATQGRAGENFGEAITLFVDLERGGYQQDLREALGAFRWVLADELKDQLKDSIWRDNASYLPTIVFQDAYDFRTTRPNLAGLSQPLQRRRVIVVRLTGFQAFFDAVADAMRSSVDLVVGG